MKEIKAEEIVDLVRSIPSGRMFSMKFKRVDAKCGVCNESNKNWNAFENCPKCGSRLSKVRFSRVQLGVTNPAHCTKPGEGIRVGESYETAVSAGRLKYFDMDCENKDGTKGNYRQAVLKNILSIHLDGEEYIIKDNKE